MKIADMLLRGLAWLALGLLRLTWWGLSHPLGDLVALVLVAVLFWRFNLGARALERNRARAMRWRARCRLRPGPGFASLAELGTQWGRTAAAHRGGRVRPGLTWGQRMVVTAATAYALRLGRAQCGKRVFGSMEANWLMIAPPRKRKSGMLADVILDWPGAVLATSTRADLFSRRRARAGGTARCTCSTRTRWAGCPPRSAGTWCPGARTRRRRSSAPTPSSGRGSRPGIWPGGRTRPPSRWPRCCMRLPCRGGPCWTSGTGPTARATPSAGPSWRVTRPRPASSGPCSRRPPGRAGPRTPSA